MKNLFLVLVFSFLGSAIFAQTDLSGTWHTGRKNTVVKMVKEDGGYYGEIVSSDDPKAKPGGRIVKNVKWVDGTWKGNLYAAKRKEWVDAEMAVKGDVLVINVSVGFFSKTLEWKAVKPDSKKDASQTEDKETVK
jgi:hypothetical protein